MGPLGLKRGEIWWADLPPPTGRRPVVLISRDESYQVRNQAIVAEVTTRIRHLPTEVELGREEGLSRPSVANADVIRTVRLERLRELAGRLSTAKMRRVDEALRFALSLDR